MARASHRRWGGPSIVGAVLVLAVLQPGLGHGQTAVTSSGLGTAVTADGSTVQITGGTRSGQNLFHSFGQFSVGAGDTAAFTNTTPALTTSNILGRVTGGAISQIFGAIDSSSYAGANLFLINPAGWVFGPTASLNVAGSFHVSTADSIRFPDVGGQAAFFHADPSRPSVLSSAPPIAFGFLGPTAAPITIQGSALQVPTGATLSIVGGDVLIGPTGDPSAEIRSTLAAPGGRVQIASVAGAGEVALDSTGALSIAPSVPRGLVEITRSDLTAVDFSGAPGGAISIVGGRLVMNGGTARVETVAADPGLQPGIRLQATEDVVLVNGASVGSVSQGDAAGGDVEVSGRNVIVDDGSVIFSQAFGLGRGGDVRVTASGEIVVSGRDAFEIPSAIGSDASGDVSLGGNVFVSAPTVTIEDGGLIRTNISASSGRGGDVIVEAGRLTITGDAGIVSIAASFLDVIRGGDLRVTADSITLSGGPLTRIASSASPAVPPPPGEFAAGDIVMRAGTISVQGGAQIQSGNFAEDAGNLTLEARDSIVISGGSRVSGQAFATTGGPVRISTPLLTVDDALIDTSTLGIGDAANISIAVGRLNLTNGGKIISSGLGDSTGRGGSIHVTANDVSISGASQTGLATTDFIADPRSGLFSETAGSGAGGDVFVNASNVTVQTGGAISARSTGTGNAGDIGLVIGNQLSVIGGVITTAATQADGGNISITTTGSVVHLSGGQITTSVQSGQGSGGNITIGSAGHPVEFVVLNDSQIRADAFGGPGGNVSISAGTFLTQGSVVSASSALSVPGTISIEAEVTDVSGSVGQLPEALFQASTLLRAACATRMAGGQSSSLVVSGREGIPAEPGSPLSSSLIAEGAVDPARADTNPSMPMWAFEPRCLR